VVNSDDGVQHCFAAIGAEEYVFNFVIFNQRQEVSEAVVFQMHLLTATLVPLAVMLFQHQK
jgi:hypothetical protein